MKITALLGLLFICAFAYAQNPATVFTIPSRKISLPCGTSCTSISATIPNIRNSNDYVVSSIPYSPFDYTTSGGTELSSLYVDDVYSSQIPLPFSFCFYGTNYNRLVVGSNAIISFDVTNASCDNSFIVAPPVPYALGPQCVFFQTYYPKASIFGPFHDIDPRFATEGKKMEWRVEGVAPKRRFISTCNNIKLFGSNCNTFATHEIVLYESTGVVEVYIKSKPSCSTHNAGKAILGMQNFTRDKAITAAGKNATMWGSENMNEAYRFTPSAGASIFKRAELRLNGSVVALADTTTGSAGELNLNFNNICPAQDSTAYTMRAVYLSCENGQEVTFDDTVVVVKSSLQVSFETTTASCTGGGSLKINYVSAGGTTEFSLNGGPFQTSSTFSNLAGGTYTVTARSGQGCLLTSTVNIPVVNNITLETMPDTLVCKGSSFTARTSSNAASFSWAPATGLSNATIANPLISATDNTLYTVTAVLGTCIQAKSFNIYTVASPSVSLGINKTIIAGDEVQLDATASQGSFLWTPSTGLSNNSILNPVASPQESTKYFLTVTNSQGCSASGEIEVVVIPYCVKPMEAFSPNGDGINDVWKINNGSCVSKVKVSVFNRYGSPVYQNTNYNNDWKGTYNGNALPEATYYFIIEYALINGKNVIQRGNVTILR